MSTTKAFLIPSDQCPTQSSLKRQLLFFDSLLVPAPEDAAILNEKEISEVFPNGKFVQWGEICPYPRSLSFDDDYRLLRARSERAVRSGKLQFVNLQARSPVEATQNWVAAIAALKTASLVKAALPDYQPDIPPLHLKSGAWYHAIVLSATGYESKYDWMTKLDSETVIPISEEWRRVAHGRLGRVLKIVRRASSDNAIPLAVDAANQNICLALGSQAYGELPTPQQLAAAAVALDTVDPIALDAALETMGWDEVFRLRKEILPPVSKLRGLLASTVKAAARPQNADINAYLGALRDLKDTYRKAQDDVSASWRKIGFRTVEAASSAIPAGLTSIAPNAAWANILTTTAVAIVVKALGGAGAEFRTIMRSGKTQKASPLFAFDRLVSLGNTAIKKGD